MMFAFLVSRVDGRSAMCSQIQHTFYRELQELEIAACFFVE